MARVIIKRKASYDYVRLRSYVSDILDCLCGERIRRGSRVLIKPNLLTAAPPEKAVTTHPLIVRAVAEYCTGKGAVTQISDSPATGSFEKILREGGYRDALKGLDVRVKEFKGSVNIDIGEPFGRIEIAEDAVDSDILINLPKLKTHTQMLLTLGVKNLFGCIVGMRKPEWHLRAGVDRDMFARLLVSISRALKPRVTILDGVLAMEGQGPGKGGTPRELGIIAASEDPVSLDIEVCGMLGLEPDRLLTNRVACDMELISDNIDVEGDRTEIKDFKLPDITPIIFGPERLHGYMRRHLIQRPVSDEDLCRLCGECWSICPAPAITPDKRNIRFDYDKCIRCYCCLEVCPHGAIRTKEPLIGRGIRKVLGK